MNIPISTINQENNRISYIIDVAVSKLQTTVQENEYYETSDDKNYIEKTETLQINEIDNSNMDLILDEENMEIDDQHKDNNKSVNKTKQYFKPTPYILMEGERLGSCILFSDHQLYTLNRGTHYRCRLYPKGCPATGRLEDNKMFRLCRSHASHEMQDKDVKRIKLMNIIKRRAMTTPDSENFERIFNEECEKPEYADIVEKVSFTVMLNNMRKIWKRYRIRDPTLQRNIMRSPIFQDVKTNHDDKDKSQCDIEQESKMAVEIGENIVCSQNMNLIPYTLIEGERTNSSVLYADGHLYTAANRRGYFRCRMATSVAHCPAAGTVINYMPKTSKTKTQQSEKTSVQLFRPTKPHQRHGTQIKEAKRLLLTAKIKTRVKTDPTSLKKIVEEECAKPEFSEVADLISYKRIYATLDRCRKRAATDILELNEPYKLASILQKEENENNDNWQVKNIEELTFVYDEISGNEIENNKSINIEDIYNDQNEDSQIIEQTLEDGEIQNNENELNTDIATVIEEFQVNYEYIPGEENCSYLFSNGYLYSYSQYKYFLCNLYPKCFAVGKIVDIDNTSKELYSTETEEVIGRKFILIQQHTSHSMQYEDKDRLLFIYALKEETKEYPDRTVKEIFFNVSDKPEFQEIAQKIKLKNVKYIIQKFKQTFVRNKSEFEKNYVFSHPDSPVSDVESIDTPPKTDLYTNAPYTLIQGEQNGSLVLYSNGHLYNHNDDHNFFCYLYPSCEGSGILQIDQPVDKIFDQHDVDGYFFKSSFCLNQQHTDHKLQYDEKLRLELFNNIKKRCILELDTSIKQIYVEEITKPKFASMCISLSFKSIQNTMMKLRECHINGEEIYTDFPSAELLEAIFDAKTYNITDETFNQLENTTNFKNSNTGTFYYVINSENFNDFEPIVEDGIEYDEIIVANNTKEETTSEIVQVYMIDIDKHNVLTDASFQHVVHLPDLSEENNILYEESNNSINLPMFSNFKIIEDALSERYYLYCDKQLYITKTEKEGSSEDLGCAEIYCCSITACDALGIALPGGIFKLVKPHTSHSNQRQEWLKMKLISKIKAKAAYKKLSCLSDIIKEEQNKPE